MQLSFQLSKLRSQLNFANSQLSDIDELNLQLKDKLKAVQVCLLYVIGAMKRLLCMSYLFSTGWTWRKTSRDYNTELKKRRGIVCDQQASAWQRQHHQKTGKWGRSTQANRAGSFQRPFWAAGRGRSNKLCARHSLKSWGTLLINFWSWLSEITISRLLIVVVTLWTLPPWYEYFL